MQRPLQLVKDLLDDYRQSSCYTRQASVSRAHISELHTQVNNQLSTQDNIELSAYLESRGKLNDDEVAILRTFLWFYVYVARTNELADLFQLGENESSSAYLRRLSTKAFRKRLRALEARYNSGHAFGLLENSLVRDISRITHSRFRQHLLGLLQLPMRSLANAYCRSHGHTERQIEFFNKTLPIFKANKCVIYKTDKLQWLCQKLW